ncbi:MAG: glycosyltransferase family 2 protein [Nitrososphaerales archaeon]
MSKYSICITNYNSANTVTTALDSILNQIDSQFEVVVVDNFSKDGSYKVLSNYAATKKIKLLQQKCSRGKGRQIAFENSTGEYIISGLDTDDVYLPRLSSLLRFYHEACEGKLLRVRRSGITIGPSALISRIGGWRDLQWNENWELSKRAAELDSYVWTIFLLAGETNPHPERRSGLGRIKYNFFRYRESLRAGRPLSELEGLEKPRKTDKLAFSLAKALSFFYPSYADGKTGFPSYGHEYFVDSNPWWPNKSDIEVKSIREWYQKYVW